MPTRLMSSNKTTMRSMNCGDIFGTVFFAFLILVSAVNTMRAQYIQEGSKLVGTGAAGNATQGQSVAISSDGYTAIVGGYTDNGNAGASWIYTRTGNTWTQQGNKLVGSGAISAGRQGVSTALSADGNTAIIGGYVDNGGIGAVWIFTRNAGTWTQQGPKLVGSGAVGAAWEGVVVALSKDGNTAIIGGVRDSNDYGAAWVFTRSGGTWSQQGSKLVPTGAVGKPGFGSAVALSADGNSAMIGGYLDSGGVGATWVFTRTAGVWSQEGSKLVGSGGVGGPNQGVAVDLSDDGNLAIVGGHMDSGSVGAAWVFVQSGGAWTQQGPKLVGSNSVGGSIQGRSVSISGDGNTAVVGGAIDDGRKGAIWIFKRNGAAWTQYGDKLVGSGASGSAFQGFATSISGDGTRIVEAGGEDNSFAGAAWVFTFHEAPVIVAISDIQNDQGGQVRIKWQKSSYDTSLSSAQVTSYSIFRRSSSGSNITAKGFALPRSIERIVMDSALLGYDYVASVPAFQLPYYQTVVPTLEDSDASGSHYFEFLVVAQTSNINQYYVSSVDSGYSVDNLAPIPPIGLMATIQPGPQVRLTWNSPTDSDVGHYDIFRSNVNDFTPSPLLKIGTSKGTNFNDTVPVAGGTNYYRIVAVDIHDNASEPSSIAQVTVTLTESFVRRENWNLISIPLSVADYAKTALFPTAISNAFAYEGIYVAYGTLVNGTGYWLKFNSAQSLPMTGLLRHTDTVNVNPGWNIIGSISSPIAASSVVSIPAGITTSKFFGYAGIYQTSDTIRPGAGYWVKVNQAGKLILSSSYPASASAIHIVSGPERPPLPPGEIGSSEIALPNTFGLEQNFPNPFNPVTRIKYSLPVDAHVTLTVYNMLGETVKILVDEQQGAGFKSVSFDASALPSGMYVYRVTAGTFTDEKKLLLIK